MLINIDTMNDASEIIHYDTTGIPLYIRIGDLSNYPDMRATGHWHDDLELIQIIDGAMNYSINGHTIRLVESDILFVNSRQMHYGYSLDKMDCRFSCILFHPSLLASNKLLYQKYVVPIMESDCLEYILVSNHEDDHSLLSSLLQQIIINKQESYPGYEFTAIGLLYQFWATLCKKQIPNTEKVSTRNESDLRIQKDMVSFIYQHFSEKLSLSQIAASGGVCRSKCCKIFKQYLMQSPIDFVNTYRLQVSLDLLVNSDMNITDIAFHCGFNHLSYYIELFQRTYHCSPNTFRTRYLRHDNLSRI